MTASRVLVIGATGILAPAADALVGRGDAVIRVSQSGGADSLAVDARDAPALAKALGEERWNQAIVYEPALSADSLQWVRECTPGRCILVRTSSAAAPAQGDIVPVANTLLLGWTVGADGRWHTPTEVSTAALQVLDDGVFRVLGTVRPWSDRP